MTLTRNQKFYSGAMVVALLGLVWDRASVGPKAAEASAVGSLLMQSPLIAASEVQSGRDDSSSANVAGHHFSQRLAVLAKDQQLDPNVSENAFGVPKAWVAKPINPASVTDASAISGPRSRRVEAFREHHLGAVMVGLRGYANVDGQGVFVGEVFDDFKLLSVTKMAAVFEWEGVQVELRLAVDSKLNRKGSLIENSAPQNGTTPLK